MDTTFEDLGLSKDLIVSLSRLGIVNPSLTQIRCIEEAKEGHSVILQSRSGTGKTVSFCIYLLDSSSERAADVIIIVPTRELAVQINVLLRSIDRTVQVSLNIGGNDINNMENNNSNVIIATPGRFQTLIKQTLRKCKGDFERYFWRSTRLLIFDEVDMLLDDHFFDQLSTICNRILNPKMQIIAVSATFIKPQFQKFEDMIHDIDNKYYTNTHSSHIVEPYPSPSEDKSQKSDIDDKVHRKDRSIPNSALISRRQESFNPPERIFKRLILSSSYISRVTRAGQLEKMSLSDVYNDTNNVQSYQYIESDLVKGFNSPSSVLHETIDFYMIKVLDAPNIIMQIGLKINCIITLLKLVEYEKCIIFCNQSHSRLQLFKALQHYGVSCVLNSSRSSHKDRTNLSQLSSLDKLVIICTDIMCRGIDVNNANLIISMDLPSNKENFLHRSGRVGRFGKTGKCITICAISEVDIFNYFLYVFNFKLKTLSTLLPSHDVNNFIDHNHIWHYKLKSLGSHTDHSHLHAEAVSYSTGDVEKEATCNVNPTAGYKTTFLELLMEESLLSLESFRSVHANYWSRL